MKKIVLIVLTVFCIVSVVLALTACASTRAEDTHDMRLVSVDEATCAEDRTEHYKCANCDHTENVPISGSALGHDLSSEWLADGGKHYKECKRSGCGEKLLQEDHKPFTVNGKPVTCFTDGLTDGTKCEVCNTILVEQQVIAACHDWRKVSEETATCQSAKVEHYICNREDCDETKDVTGGEPVNHRYEGTKYTIENGKHWQSCIFGCGTSTVKTDCEYIYSVKLGDEHNHTATCSTCGNSVDKLHVYSSDADLECNDCGYVRTPAEFLLKIGNQSVECETLAEAISKVGAEPAMIIMGGNINGSGVVIPSNKDITINLNGHTYTVCDSVVCSFDNNMRCGLQLSNNSNVTILNGTIAVGSSDNKAHLLIENYANLTLNSVTLNGSNLTNAETANGKQAVLCCYSGKVNLVNSNIIVDGNDFLLALNVFGCSDSSAVTVNVKNGCYILGKIGYGAVTEITGSLQYKVELYLFKGDWQIVFTDENDIDCDIGYVVVDGARLTHVEKKSEGCNATCTADGLTDGAVCERCGKTLKEQTAVKASGHNWQLTGESVTEPDCKTEVVKTFTCSKCGETEMEAAFGNHNLAFVPSQPAGCIETGTVEHFHCAVCSKNFSDEDAAEELANVIIEKLNHNMQYQPQADNADGTITKAFWNCSRCNKDFFDEGGEREITDNNRNELTYTPCEHTSCSWKVLTDGNDEGKHAYVCDNCGYYVDACAGNLTYQHNGNDTHAASCANNCGYPTGAVECFYDEDNNGVCICGYKGKVKITLTLDCIELEDITLWIDNIETVLASNIVYVCRGVTVRVTASVDADIEYVVSNLDLLGDDEGTPYVKTEYGIDFEIIIEAW